MRKIFSAVFLFILFITASARAEGPQVKKLADNVYAFVGANGAANSGFVVTGEGVVVIDTQGPKELALSLKEKIKEVTGKPVIYVINTHYHGDHTFGNQYFKEAREIISHENTKKDLLEKDTGHRERFKKMFGEKSLEGFELTLPTRTFREDFALKSGGEVFELKFIGAGHTSGDIVVYIPSKKVLFAGDLLYKDRLPWVADGDTGIWITALDKMKGFDASVFVPGHGGVADLGAVEDFRGYLGSLRSEVERLRREGKSLEEIKKEITLPGYSSWEKYKEWLPLNIEKVYKELAK